MHCGSSESDRRAITLLEVLLVLALLVILSAMTWPALDRPMANQRLRKAADQVRTAWTRARVEAMTTGQTFAFRCTIGENRFEIAAQAGPEAVDVPPADQAAPAAASRRHTLPEDVRFAGGQTLFDGRAAIFAQREGDAVPATGGGKPLFVMEDGIITPQFRMRNKGSAVERLVEFVGEFLILKRLVLWHSGLMPEYKEFKELLAETLQVENPPEHIYGPSVAALLGPKTLGVAVLEGET